MEAQFSLNLALNDDWFLVQMAALFARNHLTEGALVLSLGLELPRFRGDDGGARSRRRAFDH